MPAVFKQITIFDDEDEELLKQEFVRLMAKWHAKYSPYEVAAYIFRDLREPELRSQQAAQYWGSDLELRDQIDNLIHGIKTPKELDSREQRLAVLKTIYNDPLESAKDRISALQLHAQIEGEIVKSIEKKTSITDRVAMPVFQFSVRQDD